MKGQELLSLGPEETRASSVCEAFTAPLKSYLLNATDANDAVKHSTPMMRSEARRVAATVARLARPIGRDGVYEILQPCIILFGAPDYGEVTSELGKAWLSIYQEALCRQPREALEHAVSEWIANGKPFFPKPTELNKLARKRAEEVQLLAWRCRRLAESAEAEHARQDAEVSEEEAAARREVLRAMAAEMAARAAAPFEERFASRRVEPSPA